MNKTALLLERIFEELGINTGTTLDDLIPMFKVSIEYSHVRGDEHKWRALIDNSNPTNDRALQCRISVFSGTAYEAVTAAVIASNLHLFCDVDNTMHSFMSAKVFSLATEGYAKLLIKEGNYESCIP